MAEPVRFRDRAEAGARLAELCEPYRAANPLVVALAPSGVTVAAGVAAALGAELDVLAVRLLTAPEEPHPAIGAVGPSGVVVLDRPAIEALGLDEGQVEQAASTERAEMRRRMEHYRGQMDLDLNGRTALLVDDGAATGITAVAAVHATRAMGAGRVVMALGVCSTVAAALLRREADELVCAALPEPFRAVADFFETEEDLTDEEIAGLLQQARNRVGAD